MADTATNPLVITEAKSLARAADAIVALDPARRGNKNTLLNTIAQAICGQGRNWGSLKGSPSPVRDPRVAAVPTAPISADRPVVYADLCESDKFSITLPDGKTGHLPRARLAPRADGGIDVSAHLWGTSYSAAPEDRLITHMFTLDAATCARIQAEWASAPALARDTRWAEGQTGLHLTVSSFNNEIGLYFGPGVAVLLAADLFEMTRAQMARDPSGKTPETGSTEIRQPVRASTAGYRYDVQLTFVSDEMIGTDLSLGDIDWEITEGSCVGGPLEITATPLDKAARNELALQFGSNEGFFLDEEDEDTKDSPFRLADDDMIFAFYHPVAHKFYDVRVDCGHAARIRDAFQGANAPGEITVDNVTFEVFDDYQVTAVTRLFDGAVCELAIDLDALTAALSKVIDAETSG